MSKGVMVTLGILVVVVLALMGGCGMAVSSLDKEAGVRTLIEAKQRDNTSEFDNMWKKISQSAEIPAAKKDALMEIFTAHAKARTTGGGGLMKWVQESVPNVRLDEFQNLQNIVISSRDRWTARQKEILDLQRAHDLMFEKVVNGAILRAFGRDKLDRVQIITSSRTEKAFDEGVDDDVSLFQKKD